VSHGAVLLRALALLDAAAPDASEIWTRAADALATAFGERLALLGDGARAAAEAMIAGRAPAVAGVPAFAAHGTETTTLSVADRDCNAVAMIQSVFADFGSGVVAPESGVILNNRLCGFFLDPAHPNSLASGRRTMHTLHSWMAVGPAGDLLAGGSPGGDHQPQVNLQLLARLLALGESPRAAAAAPRFALWPMTVPHELARGPRRLLIEDDFGEDAAFAGRAVERAGSGLGSVKFVGAASGAVFACADRRREGAALAR
jgi:gamma-glutamyltranspeptidase/glutathione hydrolase